MSTMALAAQERADFTDLLAGLAPEQWDMPTLCADWTVRQLAAHVISYDALSWRGTLSLLARSRFSLNRANALCVAENANADLLALFRAHARPRGLTTVFGGMIPLLDGLIHQQDIRRPLGLPREIPHDRLSAALRFAFRAPPIGAPKRTRGLSVIATDVAFSHGCGPEVRGPGEALLMAIAGRSSALAELSGPGVAVLASR
ncbi:maleylpyruvate isomerase family mycothiol-dependent enzyme [Allokutzneria multivorans]|uniref:Maleylpyruvate isomerase family mycothiol-dependent enzyme n=1 Tax=Allokutzneria multivorans TaxID=1142134 RepID=A0ABP7SFR1_9PSEU